MDLTAYASDRTFIADPVTLQITAKTTRPGGLKKTTVDTITDGRRLEFRELQRQFPSVALTSESIGFQFWQASLSNISQVNPGDEIKFNSLEYIIADLRRVKFEQQYIANCHPKVVENTA